MQKQAEFLVEAVNSMTASRRTLLAVRLFGSRFKAQDQHVVATLSRWRGKTYLLSYKDLRDTD